MGIVGGNPIKFIDPLGLREVIIDPSTDAKNKRMAADCDENNTTKAIDTKKASQAIEIIREISSSIDKTYSKGININFSPNIFNFSFQGGFSIDTKGNIALQGAYNVEFTTGRGVAISLYETKTNAPTIYHLEGMGYQVGGSAGARIYGMPLNAGFDINIIPDSSQDKTYFGTTATRGFGTQGVEAHVGMSYTGTSTKYNYNIFDEAQKILGLLG